MKAMRAPRGPASGLALALGLTLCLTLAAVLGCAAGASTVPAGWSAERSGTTATLDDVGCLTATHCFAVGAAGTLLATTDGGRSWHHTASPTRAPLYRIACAAPASCYVLARPGT